MLNWLKNIFSPPAALPKKEISKPIVRADPAPVVQAETAESFKSRGDTRLDEGDWARAAAQYRKALELTPDYAEVHNNLGLALMRQGANDEAKHHLQQAVRIKPDMFNTYYVLGMLAQQLGQFVEAADHFAKVIAIRPDFKEGYIAHAGTLSDARLFDAALASYERAIALDPADPSANWGKSLVQLAMGDYENGWRQYEWRWKDFAKDVARHYPQPRWLGDLSIKDKTVLIYPEQGYGDVFQFCRYIPMLDTLGARVVLETPKEIMDLLSTLKGNFTIVEMGKPLPPFDFHCPMMSLPLAFKTTLANIPVAIPYLHSLPAKREVWSEKLGQKNNLRVGLVWSGGFRADQPDTWGVNERRNMPLAKLAQLNIPGIDFYSLQKGSVGEMQLKAVQGTSWNGPVIIDYTSEIKDFSDTAALVDNLDIIISVDTSMVHLAGAMGKPTWVLNRFDSCWRWLSNRSDSPWYPSVCLITQTRAGDWDSVITEVKHKLEAVVNTAS